MANASYEYLLGMLGDKIGVEPCWEEIVDSSVFKFYMPLDNYLQAQREPVGQSPLSGPEATLARG